MVFNTTIVSSFASWLPHFNIFPDEHNLYQLKYLNFCVSFGSAFSFISNNAGQPQIKKIIGCEYAHNDLHNILLCSPHKSKKLMWLK